MPSHIHKHLHRRQNNLLQQLGDDINQITQQVGQLVNGGQNNGPNGGPNGGGPGNHKPSDPTPPSNGPNDGPGSNGSNTFEHLEIREPNHNADGPSISYVYVTQSQTFVGPAKMSTIGVPDHPSPSPSPSPSPPPAAATTKESPSPSPTPSPSPSPARTSAKHVSSAAASTAAASTTPVSSQTSLLTSIRTTPISSTSPTTTSAFAENVSGAAISAAPTSSAAATTSSSQDTGLSGGAKAGIALGVIIGVLALAAGVFALMRSKKRREEEAYERASNEKNPFADNAAAPAPAPAPVPLMQQAPTTPLTAYGRDPARLSTAGSINPFGYNAETVQTPTSAPSTSHSEKAAMVGAAGVAAAGAVAATTVAAKRNSVPSPLKINNNANNRSQSPALAIPPAIPSPSGSQFSEASLASTAVTGPGGPPKMHRVQMDFTPTMEDELQIRAGEIVRIVREFDDGWVSLILRIWYLSNFVQCSVELIQRDNKGTVTRHQQGVVPRTCLSRLPLKPRNKRPGPPSAQPPRTASPAPSGPVVAPMGNAPMVTTPRSQSPALNPNPVKRSMSPGPYGGGPQMKNDDPRGRSRSNSAGDAQPRRTGGPGPSPMNPAAQAIKDVKELQLPIQLQSPREAPASQELPTDTVSSPGTPVTRKPVPKKTDA
jgi:hypothetical protein